MAGSSGDNVLQKFLQHLIEQYRIIENVKTQEDGICEDIRLLLKPWPRQKKEKVASKVGPALVPKDEVPTAPEVLLAEKALVKAEKTRSKFKDKASLLQPIADATAADNEIDPLQLKPGDTSNTNHSCVHPDLHHSSNSELPVLLEAVQSDIPNDEATFTNSLNPQPDIAVIPQSQLNKLLEPKLHNKSRETKGTYTNSTKPLSSRVTSSHGSKKSATSSHSKYTPAFKSAPFQTTAPVKKQNPGSTRTQMLRANANVTKTLSAPSSKGGDMSNSTKYPSQRIGQGLSQPRVKSASRDQRPKNFSLVKGDSPIEKERSSNLPRSGKDETSRKPSVLPSHPTSHTTGRSKTVEVRHGEGNMDGLELDGIERSLERMNFGGLSKHENMNNNGNNNPCDDCGEGREDMDKEQPFILQRDGKNLKLPQKLSRLISSNRKMRVKLKSAGMTKKAQDMVSARDHFLHRMDQYFSRNLTEEQLNQLRIRNNLCDEYHRLHVIFRHVCTTFLSERSSWQKVLKCKRHTEHVFITFTELEDQFFALCSKKHRKEPTNCVFKDILKKLDSNNSISHQTWLSTRLIPESLVLSPAVQYESVKDLKEYISLLHKLQTLKWELFVMEEIGEETLPYLQQNNCDNLSQDIQLYRCAYSILCSRGTTFPALLHDSEDSDEVLTDGSYGEQ